MGLIENLPPNLFRHFIWARRGSGKRPLVCRYVCGRLERGECFPLGAANINLSRKVLADLAITDPAAFAKVVEIAKKAKG